MKTRSSWKHRRHGMQTNNVCRGIGLLLLFIAGASAAASAGPPDWLQAAARESLPSYRDVSAVMLRNEQIVSIDKDGEMNTVYRCAYKILRPEGRHYGIVRIPFDSETRIQSIKAWSIPRAGGTFEVGEGDALETLLFTGNVYEDAHQKILQIPGTEPGAVIGYEFRQRRRSFILQDRWVFQQEIPVRFARFEVRLPSDWSYHEFWVNHGIVAAQPLSSRSFAWELKDLPEIKEEQYTPFWEAGAGQLFLQYISPNKKWSFTSWQEICEWYTQLTSDRRLPTAELQKKAVELTADSNDTLSKIRALTAFVQREIRYVSMDIIAGGYKPNAAQAVLNNRYGDCKDQATLLSTLLGAIGVETFYVMINSHRGVVRPEFSSPLVFDHVILAIRIPPDVPKTDFYGLVDHPRLGSLLFFNPTDSYLAFGYLPSELQSSHGLLISVPKGELIMLPLAPALSNSFLRTAKVRLTDDGDLEGVVEETFTGNSAGSFRRTWLNTPESDRKKAVLASFGNQTLSVEIRDIKARGLGETEGNPVLNYNFRLPRYANAAGELLMVRPRVLGEWSRDVVEGDERQQPVEFPSTGLYSETIEISLPAGYAVDEFPRGVAVDIGTLAYSSKNELDGTLLRYSRRMEIRDTRVSLEQVPELKKLFRQMAGDERAKAVLKRAAE